jgi:hypothetical protein
LFGLLVAVTLIAALLAMTMAHGFVGVVLLLPHLLVIVIFTSLVRYGRWRLALLVAAAFGACWVTTIFFGLPDVRDDVRIQIAGRRHSHLGDHGPLQRVSYDPMMDDSKPRATIPWYFVGNESSPCPFVATVDYGYMSAPTSGGGGKVYVAWLFGYKWIVSERLYWTS